MNTALEIDAVGQVNVERVPAANPSAGSVATPTSRWRRLAQRGGISMIALPSTHRSGPTLVEELSAPVTTTRADVDVVVTEHGVADLRGLDDREREQALRRLWG